jgi:hypothetical protein
VTVRCDVAYFSLSGCFLIFNAVAAR